MKDKTFNARNDELRARTKRARNAPTTAPDPGSIEALADATDAAIRAATTKKKATAKHPDDVTAKVAKDLKRAIAAQEKAEDAAKHAAPKPTKKKVAAIPADKVAPDTNPLAGAGAASTDLLKAAGKKRRAKPETPAAKTNWLDTGLERTGKLTVDELARAWIAHLEHGGKTTASTIASYANDLKTAIAFFGADSPVAGINAAYVDVFNRCDAVMKLKSGAPKAMPTILKMRRAFRMAVEWARENGVDKG
jgi:hypothetical protein